MVTIPDGRAAGDEAMVMLSGRLHGMGDVLDPGLVVTGTAQVSQAQLRLRM